ncbi:cell division protein FtsL [Alkalihalobacillus sp. 1P02AB]|uniref:cell division protein FtsL n=1 Tax=Alkalihalobacillus sp. 1P02AB TaxID=3132260 RepID=UPI0039A4A7EF
MSMVARNIQHQQEPLQPQRKKKVIRHVRHTVTKGERVIIAMMAVAVFLVAAFIVNNYVELYKTNTEIQGLQQQVSNQTEINAGLSLQVDEYSNPERIIEQAKEMGMTFQGDQVKAVQPQN